MKKNILLLIYIFGSFNLVFGQVLTNGTNNPAINNENPFFDVSTNFDSSISPNNEGKGLAFPRTDLTTWTFKTDLLDGVTFPTAFDGMIVYNTGTGITLTGVNNPDYPSVVSPGFYYFSNPGATTSLANGSWFRFDSVAVPPNAAEIVDYYCNTALAGNVIFSAPVVGVTQTITVNVSTLGTYNISATANGITFAASGTFTTIGPQNIVLTATGTPAAIGTFTYTLNTTPSCSFERRSLCGAFIAAGVFKEIMCHNLGADTSLNPNIPVQGIHGNYYQYGRSTLVADTNTPAAAIVGWNTSPAPFGAWAKSKTATDPCPFGYRMNFDELSVLAFNNSQSRTGTFVNNATNFGSALHFGPNTSTKYVTLPAAGARQNTNGALIGRGSFGYYWTTSGAGFWGFDSGSTYNSAVPDAAIFGFSIRCIAE